MTIKHKLTSVIMLTSIAALLLAGAAFIAWSHIAYRRDMVRDLSVQAEMIADNCKAALAFEDAEDAEEVLRALHVEPSIVCGQVYTSKGEEFAEYYRQNAHRNSCEAELQKEGYAFQNGVLTVVKNIVLDGENIGKLSVCSDLTPLYAMLKNNTCIIFVVLIVASLVAYIVSSGLKKVISGPVLDLAKVAKGVSEEKDYSIRAFKHGNDEIGTLVDAFNKMLEKVEIRDSMLVESKGLLEKRVKERTLDLTKANEQLSEDIARRELAEESLNGEKNFSETLINTMPGLFYLIEDSGKMIRWNKNFEEFTGRSDKNIESVEHVTSFIVEEDRELIAQKMQKVFDEGHACVEARMLSKDGDGVSFFFVGARIEIDNRPYLIGTGVDIDERKKAERELEETHKKLVEASRYAGMAEVATDVLHNVGNVLNSVNVSTNLITDRVANSEISNLKKVTNILEEHKDNIGEFLTDDPKGQHIPAYLIEVGKVLTEERDDITDKLRSLAENVEHIKEIVNMQQSYSKASGVEVSATVEELVESAIQINIAGLQRHGVNLIREYDEIGTIEIDKHKVLQILVNLIGNAKYALDKSDEKEKNLTIRFGKHDADQLKIEVIDNGIGISQKHLTEIFRHGFTTKKDGHGFGLHSGVLAAKELGGSLTVHSDGLGHGSSFVLELPYKTVEVS
jgi:PAS domain S-box-containing protein